MTALPHRRISLPDAAVAVFDALLVFMAIWSSILPRLVGRALQTPLPFHGRYSAVLSLQHLVTFWVLLFARQHVGCRSGRSGWLARSLRQASPLAQGTLLVLAAILFFLSVSRGPDFSGDTVGTKLLPVSILEEGNLDLDEFVSGIRPEHLYGVTRIGDRSYSSFPIFTGIAALPAYVPFYLWSKDAFSSWRASYSLPGGDTGPNVVNVMAQLAAAILVSLSVLVVWIFCRRVSGDPEYALWITTAYALGTPILSTASQGLWMHGPSCLFLALAFFSLLRSDESGSVAAVLAALALVAAFALRPVNAVFLPFLSARAFQIRRVAGVWFLLSASVGVAAVLSANYEVYGRVLGAYESNAHRFGNPLRPGILATILLSPSRGLFAFCPFLIFALWPSRAGGADRGIRASLLAGALSTALVVCGYEVWTGGYSFGPRLLCESALCLTLLLAFQRDALRDRAAVWSLFLAAVLFSCHLHVRGTSHGDGGWTTAVFAGRQDLPLLWSVRDSQLVWTLAK